MQWMQNGYGEKGRERSPIEATPVWRRRPFSWYNDTGRKTLV